MLQHGFPPIHNVQYIQPRARHDIRRSALLPETRILDLRKIAVVAHRSGRKVARCQLREQREALEVRVAAEIAQADVERIPLGTEGLTVEELLGTTVG